MAGTNVLGDVRPGGVVLWTHPTRTTKRGAPMPVLAIGDEGDGRSIALGIDAGWTACSAWSSARGRRGAATARCGTVCSGG